MENKEIFTVIYPIDDGQTIEYDYCEGLEETKRFLLEELDAFNELNSDESYFFVFKGKLKPLKFKQVISIEEE